MILERGVYFAAESKANKPHCRIIDVELSMSNYRSSITIVDSHLNISGALQPKTNIKTTEETAQNGVVVWMTARLISLGVCSLEDADVFAPSRIWLMPEWVWKE